MFLTSLQRRAAVVAVAVVGLSASPARPRAQNSTPGPDAARFSRIDELVRDAIAQHQLPGAVVLVGRGDAVLYTQAIGQRAVPPAPEPMTEDTIFDLASLTKVVAT